MGRCIGVYHKLLAGLQRVAVAFDHLFVASRSVIFHGDTIFLGVDMFLRLVSAYISRGEPHHPASAGAAAFTTDLDINGSLQVSSTFSTHICTSGICIPLDPQRHHELPF